MIEPISKFKALKWVVLTSIMLWGIVVFIITLYITGWYFAMRFAGTPYHGQPPAHVRNSAMVWGVVIGEWLTVWICWFFFSKTSPFSSLFQTHATSRLWQEFGTGIIIAGLLVCLGSLLRPHFAPMPALFIVLTSLTAGLCEEFLYRGFLMFLLARAGFGWVSQIMWSSLAFGLGHLYMGPWAVGWATFVGVVFATIKLWRGNVWATVTAHSLIDLCFMFRLFPMHH